MHSKLSKDYGYGSDAYHHKAPLKELPLDTRPVPTAALVPTCNRSHSTKLHRTLSSLSFDTVHISWVIDHTSWKMATNALGH